MIFTIGYSKWKVDQLLKVMAEKEISLLVDIRSVPYGRFAPFNRPNLARVLGSRYIWKGEILGGKYGPAGEEGIDWLIAVAQGRNIVIMCVEADPRKCHRLSDVSARLYLEHGIDVVHLLDNGTERTTSSYLGNLGGV
jgi:uncharacterized protein (DUF488 family)